MTDKLEAMHDEIETIFSVDVDHIHADILHYFIDEQQAEIDRLKSELSNRLKMDAFTNIARRKVAYMVRRDDFKALLAINNHSAVIEFYSGKRCIVDGFGRVTWNTDEVEQQI